MITEFRSRSYNHCRYFHTHQICVCPVCLLRATNQIAHSLWPLSWRLRPNPVTYRVNFLRCNASGQLALVHSVPLHESTNNYLSSFASGPNGSVLCAIYGSNTVHEICRASGAAAAPFADASKEYRLPDKVRYICGLQCVGEQRLVASFCDNSVRVFRLTGGALSEMQRVTEPATEWSPAISRGTFQWRDLHWLWLQRPHRFKYEVRHRSLRSGRERLVVVSPAPVTVHEHSTSLVPPARAGRLRQLSSYHCG